MQIINLKIFKSDDNEVIRNIYFNKKGLSLIVIEKEGDKNILIDVINICLGARSVSSLYKSKYTNENLTLKEFLSINKVKAELTCLIDNVKHKFSRDLFLKGGYWIDGNIIRNLNQYNETLNLLIFNKKNNEFTFRQLISKFIILNNSTDSNFLRFLGSFINNYQYNQIYSMLFGIDGNGVVENQKELTQKDLLVKNIKQVEDTKSKINLEITLLENQIEKNIDNKFIVNIKDLKKLFDETNLLMDGKLCDYKRLVEFHNGMIKKRTIFLNKELIDLKQKSKELDERINKFYNKYNEVEQIELLSYKDFQLKEYKRVENEFNSFFSRYTEKILGDSYFLNIDKSLDKKLFFLKISGQNNKFGSGIKKVLSVCFDLAYINLIIKKNIHMPIFIIHEYIENISCEFLKGLVKESRKFKGQYICSMFYNQINSINIKDEEIISILSTIEKFFKI